MATLSSLLRKCMFDVVRMDNRWVTKETTCVARRIDRPALEADVDQPGPNHAARQVAWLWKLLDQADAISRRQPIALFGSSIASSWVASTIHQNLLFFVDEDNAPKAERGWTGRSFILKSVPGCLFSSPCPAPRPGRSDSACKPLTQTFN